MKYFILIILFFGSLSAQLKPDSYLDRLEETEGAVRVDILNKIAEVYRDMSDTEQAMSYAEKALAEAKVLEYTSGQIDASNILATVYLLAQQLEQGIEYTRNALKQSERLEYRFGIANSYRNIGIYRIYGGQPNLALDTLQFAVNIFKELNDTLGTATALTSLGVANSRVNKMDESLALFKEAAELFLVKGNNFQAAHAFLNLGSIYTTVVGDYREGLEYSLKALENFRAAGDDFKAAYAMIVVGNAYEELGDLQLPVKYYTDALEIFKEANNSYLIINAINNLGEVYKARREFNIAVDFYEQALEKSKEDQNEEGIAVALNNIGECYFQLGSHGLSLDYYNQSFTLLEKMNDLYKMAISLNNQASAHIKLKNPQRAILKSERAIDYAKKVGSKEEIKNGLENLYLANKNLNRYKEALEHFLEYEQLKDSLVQAQTSNELSRILAEHKAVQNEKEIELLTKNSELKEAELARQEILTYFLIAISITLLIFGGVYYLRYTERKNMNKKLVEAAKELNELNKTKDLFFSIIAHDLRGPFNSLLGLTEILAEDTNELSENEIKNLSKEVNQNARNVFLLLENLLEWSSSQLGKISYSPEKFDINELVAQNINLYKKAASVKNINIKLTHSNDAYVYGDKNMLDSVIRNLINNAIKFTGSNGHIDIDTYKENGHVVFSVKDNGVGIAQLEIDKIFNLGSDVKSAGTSNEKGTGLGLVLCKDFVNKNNGTIEVSSEEGKGSVFKVTLPTEN